MCKSILIPRGSRGYGVHAGRCTNRNAALLAVPVRIPLNTCDIGHCKHRLRQKRTLPAYHGRCPLTTNAARIKLFRAGPPTTRLGRCTFICASSKRTASCTRIGICQLLRLRIFVDHREFLLDGCRCRALSDCSLRSRGAALLPALNAAREQTFRRTRLHDARGAKKRFMYGYVKRRGVRPPYPTGLVSCENVIAARHASRLYCTAPLRSSVTPISVRGVERTVAQQ